jgi:uncharacterized membrane protein YecN with MAPEG domain
MIERQQTDKERIASLEATLKALQEQVKEFVTKDQFLPVKLIVYGLIGIVGSSVVVSLLGRVFVK